MIYFILWVIIVESQQQWTNMLQETLRDYVSRDTSPRWSCSVVKGHEHPVKKKDHGHSSGAFIVDFAQVLFHNGIYQKISIQDKQWKKKENKLDEKTN